MKVTVIPFEQPAGTFFLAAMSAAEVIRMSRIGFRKYDSEIMDTTGSIQREPSKPRVREISDYAETVDAAFPTPILLALDKDCYSLTDNEITIKGDRVADIVDGQHRILGLRDSSVTKEFTLPVVLLLEPTEEQKALIFATINGKQTKVPASVIYELFGVTTTRSPQKTAHEVARAINSTRSSPWYRRLKMLGKKTPRSDETLSQGTFVKLLLPHISDDPDADFDAARSKHEFAIREGCVFNAYFRKNDDSAIVKILLNMFAGVRETWPAEWDDPKQFILTKTVGAEGIMKALPPLVRKGKRQKDLSTAFFRGVFASVDTALRRGNLQLTSSCFPSSSSGAAKLREMIIGAVEGQAK